MRKTNKIILQCYHPTQISQNIRKEKKKLIVGQVILRVPSNPPSSLHYIMKENTLHVSRYISTWISWGNSMVAIATGYLYSYQGKSLWLP